MLIGGNASCVSNHLKSKILRLNNSKKLIKLKSNNCQIPPSTKPTVGLSMVNKFGKMRHKSTKAAPKNSRCIKVLSSNDLGTINFKFFISFNFRKAPLTNGKRRFLVNN